MNCPWSGTPTRPWQSGDGLLTVDAQSPVLPTGPHPRQHDRELATGPVSREPRAVRTTYCRCCHASSSSGRSQSSPSATSLKRVTSDTWSDSVCSSRNVTSTRRARRNFTLSSRRRRPSSSKCGFYSLQHRDTSEPPRLHATSRSGNRDAFCPSCPRFFDATFHSSASWIAGHRPGAALTRLAKEGRRSKSGLVREMPRHEGALAAGADLLVTGDRALLTLGTIEGLTLVKPREAYERLLGSR